MKLPDNVTIKQIKSYWDLAQTEYRKPMKRMTLLDGADRNKMWDVVGVKLPDYHLKPETNHVHYIKDNVLNSVYTVTKWAEAYPKTQEGIQTAEAFNVMFSALWDELNVQDVQLQAGERAALLNLGITQVGWDSSAIYEDLNGVSQGMPTLKNIDPIKFRRDPYANDLESGRFCFYADEYHIDTLKANPLYAKGIDKLEKEFSSTEALPKYHTDISQGANKANTKYLNLIICWVKVYDEKEKRTKLHVVHTIDAKHVIAVEEDRLPNRYPFALLYCNLPNHDPIGISEPAKIFINSFLYNFMHSIIATHALKASRPPKFLNRQSGLNARTLAKYGNDVDKVFIVNGLARDAVHFMEFPPLPPELTVLLQTLPTDIMSVTGIDERYTGRDTGSIITTGGVEDMLTRVTLRDSVKIINYEKYAKDLTSLIMDNMREFSEERTFLHIDPNSNKALSSTINFPALQGAKIQYSISISSELPKSKARMAQMANLLMEKQMQYGMNPPIITPEEWLSMQDFPNKSLIKGRMEQDRQYNKTEDITRTLTQFAELIEQGVPADQAIQMMVTDEQPPMTNEMPPNV